MNKPLKYNPEIHHRRSIRLRGYDYSNEGMYFITICTHERKHIFGEIRDDQMILNELGIIANEQWLDLTNRFNNIELDAHQIMPNHMHGIIAIIKEADENKKITIGDITGAYKSLVSNRCLEIFKSRVKQWGN